MMSFRSFVAIIAIGMCLALVSGCPPPEPKLSVSVTIGDPSVTATSTGPVDYTVTYINAVLVSLTSDDVTLNRTGDATGTVSVSGSGTSTRLVTISDINGVGEMGISISAGTASDSQGGLATAAGPSTTFNVDDTAPTLSIGEPSSTDTVAGPVTYTITYSGAETISLASVDVTLNIITGDATGTVSVDGTGPSSRTVMVSDITGNGELGISIAAGTASDSAGNLAAGAGPSTTFNVSDQGPMLSIGEPSVADTNTGPVTYAVLYTGADSVTLTSDDVSLISTNSLTGVLSVSGTGTDDRTATISDIVGVGELAIAIAASTASDMAGNFVGGAGPSTPFNVLGPAPTLVPGAGFTSATADPPVIGSGLGADAKAIARWDVVPFQTFDGIFQIGVIAFHMMGIDRVEFSVEGGDFTQAPVTAMTFNSRTGVVEYWVNLDANDFVDGPIEVRAIVYPNVGIPRVLDEDPDVEDSYVIGERALVLLANRDGTYDPNVAYVSITGSDSTGDGSESDPYQTVVQAVSQASGGGSAGAVTVYLLAGTYDGLNFAGPASTDTWFTVAGAPGLTRDQVIALSTVFINNADKYHLLNLTVALSSDPSRGLGISAGDTRFAWLDNVAIIGESRTIHGNISRSSKGISGGYTTGVLLENNVDGIPFAFQRDNIIRHIGVDAYTRGRLVINCVVEDIDRDLSGVGGAHPDVYQLGGGTSNFIVYGLLATKDIHAQGVFGGRGTENFAVVNAFIDNGPFPHTFSVGGIDQPVLHMVVKDSVFLGRGNPLRNIDTNILLDSSQFRREPPFLMNNTDQPDVIVIPPTIIFE